MSNSPKSKFVTALLATVLCAWVGGCAANPGDATEILTQKDIGAGRTPITVLVKYAFTINAFEEAVEARFPDIDLVQVGNYTLDMGIAEYEARLEHDDLPDMVMTWPLDVGQEYWSDRLLDLSALPFTSQYNLSMLNDIAQDGSLYYLPGPSQIRGIIYNKTLFQENGWSVPTDFDGFLALCRTIENSGMRALQLGLGNAEVLDTAFVGYSYGNCYSSPGDAVWLRGYNRGTGSFGDHFMPALDTFQTLVDEGILRPGDLDITYSAREKMLFNRQCAMVEDSVLMTQMGYSLTGTTDEFALMPFFSPDGGEDWARLYMVCYVGLNQHLADPANQAKYDLAMQLMDYISTPEGQQALMGDTGAMFSSLSDVASPDVPEIDDLRGALEAGRFAIFPALQNAQGALREGLAGMVRGDTTAREVVAMVDAQNAAPPQVSPPTVLGTATADFTLIETGGFVADTMRAASGCEIALFLDNGKDGLYNGKGISGRLYQGDVTDLDLSRILPDLKEGDQGLLCQVSMRGEDLLYTLEHAIPVDNGQTGWFYYFSGLRMEYDPTAQPGSRLRSLSTQDGKPIQADQIYTIAAMDNSVPIDRLQSHVTTDLTIAQLLRDAVTQAGTIAPSGDGRFTVISGG